MSKSFIIQLGDLQVEVQQKRMKTIRFTVYPPDGRVRITAPYHLNRSQILEVAARRLDWIRKQINRIEKAPREEELRYEEGASHSFLGKPVKLRLSRSPGAPVQVKGGSLLIPGGTSMQSGEIRKKLEGFYREELRRFMAGRIPIWERRMNVEVRGFGIRKMRTLWGSCNMRAHRIWLNLELARKSEECIEAILVHEMVHLKERLHNDRFYGFMDQYLPDWREREKELGGYRSR